MSLHTHGEKKIDLHRSFKVLNGSVSAKSARDLGSQSVPFMIIR